MSLTNKNTIKSLTNMIVIQFEIFVNSAYKKHSPAAAYKKLYFLFLNIVWRKLKN